MSIHEVRNLKRVTDVSVALLEDDNMKNLINMFMVSEKADKTLPPFTRNYHFTYVK